jgi:DNA-binding beta-propeller fold protein YncE
VILPTAAALSLLGLSLFGMGLALDRPETAMLGAIVIIGVGGTGAVQGYQVQVGVDETVTTEERLGSVGDIGNSTYETDLSVSGREPTPTGVEFAPEGRRMYVAGTGSDSVHQYDTGRFDVSLATHNETLALAHDDPRSVEVADSGTAMYVADAANATVYEYELSEAYNVSTASQSGQLPVGSEDADPRRADVADSGERLYVVGASSDTVYEYSLGTPYDLSTASLDDRFDVGGQVSAPTGMDFSSDGTRMLVSDSSDNTVHEYELSSPFRVASAQYADQSLYVRGDVGTSAAVAFENGGFESFLADSGNGDVVQYDSTAVTTVETTDRDRVYEDVETHSEFPLDLMVLIIGAVMFFGATGRASEVDLGGDDYT